MSKCVYKFCNSVIISGAAAGSNLLAPYTSPPSKYAGRKEEVKTCTVLWIIKPFR